MKREHIEQAIDNLKRSLQELQADGASEEAQKPYRDNLDKYQHLLTKQRVGQK